MTNFYFDTNKIVSKNDCFNLNYYQNISNKIINDDNLTDEEKEFLLILSTRYIIFKYENLANYYNSANDNVRDYMEDLHAVIVDKDTAILKGYLKYQEDYNSYIDELIVTNSEE